MNEDQERYLLHEILRRYGVRDVNEPAPDGMTPLIKASAISNEDVVLLLLKYGADIETKDKQGRTPLRIAAEFRNTEVLAVLLQKGADLMARDIMGRTALDFAREGGGLYAKVAQMIEAEALRRGQQKTKPVNSQTKRPPQGGWQFFKRP